eukprot:5839501-Prorocentrum_lima.AAC.1
MKHLFSTLQRRSANPRATEAVAPAIPPPSDCWQHPCTFWHQGQQWESDSKSGSSPVGCWGVRPVALLTLCLLGAGA